MMNSSLEVLVTVIVPVFNEVQTVGKVIERVQGLTFLGLHEVVVVDDGSSDGTAEALQAWADSDDVTIVRHHANRGKGDAIRSGLAVARGEIVAIQDADLEYSPEELPRLASPIAKGEACIVYGSRRMGHSIDWGNRFYHAVTVLNLLTRILYGIRITDEATCYKLFRFEILRRMELECRKFEFCPEVTAKAARMGHSIRELPISYDRRSVKDGKKIRLSDWFEAVRTLWRYRKWEACNLADEPAQTIEQSHPLCADKLRCEQL